MFHQKSFLLSLTAMKPHSPFVSLAEAEILLFTGWCSAHPGSGVEQHDFNQGTLQIILQQKTKFL